MQEAASTLGQGKQREEFGTIKIQKLKEELLPSCNLDLRGGGAPQLVPAFLCLAKGPQGPKTHTSEEGALANWCWSL